MELMANPKFILILRPHCYLIEKERRREGETERGIIIIIIIIIIR